MRLVKVLMAVPAARVSLQSSMSRQGERERRGYQNTNHTGLSKHDIGAKLFELHTAVLDVLFQMVMPGCSKAT